MSRIQPINKQPKISSLAIAFKRATGVTEDVAEAKREHRSNLRMLVDKYMDDVNEGKADGIRNAKELVEVIKADMLLMGEATERKDTNALDEIRVRKVSQVLDGLDLESGDMKTLVSSVLMAMNEANDDQDTNAKSLAINMVEVEEGIVES